MQNPERDPAMDLLGEEAADGRFGGDGRGCWGEYFTQGGDGDGHWSWPDGPGDGSDDPVASEIEDRREAKAGLGRFDRPRSWPVGLDPAGVAGLGQWANGPKPIC
jgi:hypothetical protein